MARREAGAELSLPFETTERMLAAGTHRLRFTIVGSHPQAEPAYYVGIDAIRLERLR